MVPSLGDDVRAVRPRLTPQHRNHRTAPSVNQYHAPCVIIIVSRLACASRISRVQNPKADLALAAVDGAA